MMPNSQKMPQWRCSVMQM